MRNIVYVLLIYPRRKCISFLSMCNANRNIISSVCIQNSKNSQIRRKRYFARDLVNVFMDSTCPSVYPFEITSFSETYTLWMNGFHFGLDEKLRRECVIQCRCKISAKCYGTDNYSWRVLCQKQVSRAVHRHVSALFTTKWCGIPLKYTKTV